MNAATITVKAERLGSDAGVDEDRALGRAFGDVLRECRFSCKPAPGNRGTEIHASSVRLTKKEMKQRLRVYRALIEAGEMPTGARTR
jgi:hypothetical protein